MSSHRPVSASAASPLREKVPLKIQTLELNLDSNTKKIQPKPEKQRYKRVKNYKRALSSYNDEASSDSSVELNKYFLSLNMFDTRRLTLGEMKQKYRNNKNRNIKNDVLKLISSNYYEYTVDHYDEYENHQKSYKRTPKTPAKIILCTGKIFCPWSIPKVCICKGEKSKKIGHVRFNKFSVDKGEESSSSCSSEVNIFMPKCRTDELASQ